MIPKGEIVRSSRTELTCPVTRRVIGHARLRHEDDCAQFSSVQLVCCEHGFTTRVDGWHDVVSSFHVLGCCDMVGRRLRANA